MGGTLDNFFVEIIQRNPLDAPSRVLQIEMAFGVCTHRFHYRVMGRRNEINDVAIFKDLDLAARDYIVFLPNDSRDYDLTFGQDSDFLHAMSSSCLQLCHELYDLFVLFSNAIRQE